jgi:cytochrome c peroxidase/DNA-binding beta-propeller fold protein YncE
MKSIRHGLWMGGCACAFVACARDGRTPASATPLSVAHAPPAAPVPACGRLHPGVGAARVGDVRAGSPVALAASRSDKGERVVAYVADADEPTLHTVDVDARSEVASTPLAGRPEQVMVLADGRVAVTLRASNAVQVLEPSERAEAGLASRCVVETPSEPVALAATPDDATVLVTAGWAHALAAFDARTFAPEYQVSLPRDPRAVVVSDDGSRAFVAHVVEARMSVVDLSTREHEARLIDLRAHPAGDAPQNPSRKGCQGFALAKVGAPSDSELAKKMVDRVFAPMVSVSSGDGGESSGYGSDSPSEVSEVAVVDAAAERALTRTATVPEGGTAQGQCLLPRAAAYDDGALYVTCLGIDALVELDARGVDPANAERRRWRVASGPTGVAIDHANHRAVVWSQFDREVAILPLAGDGAAPAARLAVARHADGLSASVALGRRLFHATGDAHISADGRACASCHPDGREDALTWSTPDGPRQTPMLAGRVTGTGPYGWLGSSPKLEDHLKKTFERLSGDGLPDADLAALIDYVSTLTPPIAQPAAGTPEREKLVARGHDLFASAETACSTCHDAGRAFADGQRHQVLVQPTQGQPDGFDTPSLRFVAGTAPYFHDGRYKTLDDVLTAPDHAMGQSTHLTRQDRAALVAYLETL